MLQWDNRFKGIGLTDQICNADTQKSHTCDGLVVSGGWLISLWKQVKLFRGICGNSYEFS